MDAIEKLNWNLCQGKRNGKKCACRVPFQVIKGEMHVWIWCSASSSVVVVGRSCNYLLGQLLTNRRRRRKMEFACDLINNKYNY